MIQFYFITKSERDGLVSSSSIRRSTASYAWMWHWILAPIFFTKTDVILLLGATLTMLFFVRDYSNTTLGPPAGKKNRNSKSSKLQTKATNKWLNCNSSELCEYRILSEWIRAASTESMTALWTFQNISYIYRSFIFCVTLFAYRSRTRMQSRLQMCALFRSIHSIKLFRSDSFRFICENIFKLASATIKNKNKNKKSK